MMPHTFTGLTGGTEMELRSAYYTVRNNAINAIGLNILPSKLKYSSVKPTSIDFERRRVEEPSLQSLFHLSSVKIVWWVQLQFLR